MHENPQAQRKKVFEWRSHWKRRESRIVIIFGTFLPDKIYFIRYPHPHLQRRMFRKLRPRGRLGNTFLSPCRRCHLWRENLKTAYLNFYIAKQSKKQASLYSKSLKNISVIFFLKLVILFSDIVGFFLLFTGAIEFLKRHVETWPLLAVLLLD